MAACVEHRELASLRAEVTDTRWEPSPELSRWCSIVAKEALSMTAVQTTADLEWSNERAAHGTHPLTSLQSSILMRLIESSRTVPDELKEAERDASDHTLGLQWVEARPRMGVNSTISALLRKQKLDEHAVVLFTLHATAWVSVFLHAGGRPWMEPVYEAPVTLGRPWAGLPACPNPPMTHDSHDLYTPPTPEVPTGSRLPFPASMAPLIATGPEWIYPVAGTATLELDEHADAATELLGPYAGYVFGITQRDVPITAPDTGSNVSMYTNYAGANDNTVPIPDAILLPPAAVRTDGTQLSDEASRGIAISLRLNGMGSIIDMPHGSQPVTTLKPFVNRGYDTARQAVREAIPDMHKTVRQVMFNIAGRSRAPLELRRPSGFRQIVSNGRFSVPLGFKDAELVDLNDRGFCFPTLYNLALVLLRSADNEMRHILLTTCWALKIRPVQQGRLEVQMMQASPASNSPLAGLLATYSGQPLDNEELLRAMDGGMDEFLMAELGVPLSPEANVAEAKAARAVADAKGSPRYTCPQIDGMCSAWLAATRKSSMAAAGVTFRSQTAWYVTPSGEQARIDRRHVDRLLRQAHYELAMAVPRQPSTATPAPLLQPPAATPPTPQPSPAQPKPAPATSPPSEQPRRPTMKAGSAPRPPRQHHSPSSTPRVTLAPRAPYQPPTGRWTAVASPTQLLDNRAPLAPPSAPTSPEEQPEAWSLPYARPKRVEHRSGQQPLITAPRPSAAPHSATPILSRETYPYAHRSCPHYRRPPSMAAQEIKDASSDLLPVTLTKGGVKTPLVVLCDTGAQASLMYENELEALGLTMPTRLSGMTIRGINNQMMETRGPLQVRLYLTDDDVAQLTHDTTPEACRLTPTDNAFQDVDVYVMTGHSPKGYDFQIILGRRAIRLDKTIGKAHAYHYAYNDNGPERLPFQSALLTNEQDALVVNRLMTNAQRDRIDHRYDAYLALAAPSAASSGQALITRYSLTLLAATLTVTAAIAGGAPAAAALLAALLIAYFPCKLRLVCIETNPGWLAPYPPCKLRLVCVETNPGWREQNTYRTGEEAAALEALGSQRAAAVLPAMDTPEDATDSPATAGPAIYHTRESRIRGLEPLASFIATALLAAVVSMAPPTSSQHAVTTFVPHFRRPVPAITPPGMHSMYAASAYATSSAGAIYGEETARFAVGSEGPCIRCGLEGHSTSADGQCDLYDEVMAADHSAFLRRIRATVDDDEDAEDALDNHPPLANDPPAFTWESLQLNSTQLSPDLPAHQRQRLVQLVWDNRDIFGPLLSREERIEQRNYDPINVVLNDYTPIPHRGARSVNPALKQALAEKVGELVGAGVWRRCEDQRPGQYCSPCVIAPKRDGGIRLCVDLRELNKRTAPDSYTMPTIDDCMHWAQGKGLFSTIDMFMGFFQMPIEPRSQHYFRCLVPGMGYYEHTAMPMGWSNSMFAFQRWAEGVFEDSRTRGEVFMYVDDGNCGTPTHADPEIEFQMHVDALTRLFTQARQAGARFKFSKVRLGYRTVEVVGQMTDGVRRWPSPERTASIRELPIPTHARELESWMGAVGYYRPYVARFAQKVEPIQAHLNISRGRKLAGAYAWKPACQTSWDDISREITSVHANNKLFLPDFNLPFTVYSDASDVAAAAVLTQRLPDGNEVPVFFYSHRFNDPQRRWTVTEREMFAFVGACRKWKSLLMQVRFNWATDHKNLVTIKDFTDATSSKIIRWGQEISLLDFRHHHIDGESNVFADLLSRLCPPHAAKPATAAEANVMAAVFAAIARPKRQAAEAAKRNITEMAPKPRRRVSFADTADVAAPPATPQSDISPGLEAPNEGVNEGGPDSEPPIQAAAAPFLPTTAHAPPSVADTRAELLGDAAEVYLDFPYDETILPPVATITPFLSSVHEAQQAEEASAEVKTWEKNDAVYYRIRAGGLSIYTRYNRVIIPTHARALITQAIEAAHDCHGHGGISRVLDSLHAHRLWWRNMSTDVTHHINNCPSCLLAKAPRGNPTGHLSTIQADRPFQFVVADYLGPFPLGALGHSYILSMVDRFTRYVTLVPAKAADGATTAAIFENQLLFGTFGRPAVIQTDNGSHFRNADVAGLLAKFGVQHHFSAPEHPQSNGIVERSNSSVTALLRIYSGNNHSAWDTVVRRAEYIINRQRNDAIGVSPYEAIFGTSDQSPVAKLVGELDPGFGSLEHYHEAVHAIRDSVLLHSERAFERAKGYHDKGRTREQTLEPGTLVLLVAKDKSSKMDPPYRGPSLVVKKASPLTYLVRNIATANTTVAHVDKIRVIDSSVTNIHHIDHRDRAADKPRRSVTAVTAHRRVAGYLEFQVTWSDASADSWEPEHLLCKEESYRAYVVKNALPDLLRAYLTTDYKGGRAGGGRLRLEATVEPLSIAKHRKTAYGHLEYAVRWPWEPERVVWESIDEVRSTSAYKTYIIANPAAAPRRQSRKRPCPDEIISHSINPRSQAAYGLLLETKLDDGTVEWLTFDDFLIWQPADPATGLPEGNAIAQPAGEYVERVLPEIYKQL